MPTWIRVRDTTTGHQYDVRDDTVRSLPTGVEVVPGYPPHSGPDARPRPPKPHVAKDGTFAPPRSKSAPAEQGQADTEGAS